MDSPSHTTVRAVRHTAVPNADAVFLHLPEKILPTNGSCGDFFQANTKEYPVPACNVYSSVELQYSHSTGQQFENHPTFIAKTF